MKKISEPTVHYRPSPEDSHKSKSTERSVTAFIERTVSSMALLETDTVKAFLPPPRYVVTTCSENLIFPKVSVSDYITVLQDSQEDVQGRLTGMKFFLAQKQKPCMRTLVTLRSNLKVPALKPFCLPRRSDY